MKNGVILNPVSGRGRSLRVMPKIIKWADENRQEFELFTTTAPGDGVRLGKLCRFKQFDRVIAVGGDGTVNEVATALAGSDIVLGIIPGGSGNDFYKMLGNNGNRKNGFETAFKGKPRRVDIGLINGRPFFNSVGIGFDAEVARRASQYTAISGMLVYLVAVFQSWRNLKPIEVEIEIDKVKIESKITLLCVGNGRSSGGGFYLTPHADFDDGLLDICIIEALPKSKIFTYLPRTLNGSHVRLPGVKVYRAKKILVSSYREFPIHIDGELVATPVKKTEFRIDTRKLKIATAAE